MLGSLGKVHYFQNNIKHSPLKTNLLIFDITIPAVRSYRIVIINDDIGKFEHDRMRPNCMATPDVSQIGQKHFWFCSCLIYNYEVAIIFVIFRMRHIRHNIENAMSEIQFS